MSSKATQCESLDPIPPSQEITSSSKKQTNYDALMLYDYLDLDNPMDLEKLKTWCHAHWFTTIRKALIHRNLLQYHACCNSFSRRHFSRHTSHPQDETFDIHKLRDFKAIESGDDLFRWQSNLAKENARLGLRTLFPSLNLKACQYAEEKGTFLDDCEQKTMLRKRLGDLERELEDKGRLLSHIQKENSRLLRSSKAWHLKYEELLEQMSPTNELLVTPVKKTKSNWLDFPEDN